MRFFLFLSVIFNSVIYYGQENSENICSLGIVAHTDSSLYVLQERKDNKNNWDFYITSFSVKNKTIKVDVCLRLNNLYNGKFDNGKFRYQVLDTKKNILFFFDNYIGKSKVSICKIIEYNGTVSDFFVLNKVDITNDNIYNVEYSFQTTNTGSLLHRTDVFLKSGFIQSSLSLYNNNLVKTWTYNLEKTKSYREAGFLEDVYNDTQFIEYSAKQENYISNKKNKRVELAQDKLFEIKIEGINYLFKGLGNDLEFRIIKPRANEQKTISIPWCFSKTPIAKYLSSNQILFYELVDIKDVDEKQETRKALCYKRFDIKLNKIISDSIILFDKYQNEKFHELWATGYKDKLTLYDFNLSFEKIINGNLYSFFKHNDSRNIVVFSYNISTGNLNWIKRESINSISYFNKPLFYSFHDNSFNIGFNALTKSSGKKNDSRIHKEDNQISLYNITDNGVFTYSQTTVIDEKFLFPWLFNKTSSSNDFFLSSDEFLPKKFINE